MFMFWFSLKLTGTNYFFSKKKWVLQLYPLHPLQREPCLTGTPQTNCWSKNSSIRWHFLHSYWIWPLQINISTKTLVEFHMALGDLHYILEYPIYVRDKIKLVWDKIIFPETKLLSMDNILSRWIVDTIVVWKL